MHTHTHTLACMHAYLDSMNIAEVSLGQTVIMRWSKKATPVAKSEPNSTMSR